MLLLGGRVDQARIRVIPRLEFLDALEVARVSNNDVNFGVVRAGSAVFSCSAIAVVIVRSGIAEAVRLVKPNAAPERRQYNSR
jgi:hypothetical protein